MVYGTMLVVVVMALTTGNHRLISRSFRRLISSRLPRAGDLEGSKLGEPTFVVAMEVGFGFLDEDELVGLKPNEVRAKCGEPLASYDYRPDANKVLWVYTHWMPGCYSTVEFKDDIVVKVLQGAK